MRDLISTLYSLTFVSIFRTCESISSPPLLITNETSRELMVKPHESIVLECPVRHQRNNIYEWYKELGSISTFSDRMKILNTGGLKIKDTLFGDTAVYRCRAINGFGSVEFNTTLLVIGKGSETDYYQYDYDYGLNLDDQPAEDSKISLTYKPRIVHVSDRSSPVSKQVGDTFKFVCVATGFPVPQISWYKDGNKVTNGRMGKWSLAITHSILTDSGNYTCVAQNILGRDTYSFQLLLYPYGAYLSGKPILTGGNVTLVEEGQPAVLECAIRSMPLLHFEWLKQVDGNNKDKNGYPIQMRGEYFNVLAKKHQIETTSEGNIHYHKLTIKNTLLEDAGKYVCLGANINGYEYRFAFLEVLQNDLDSSSSLNFPIIVTVIAVVVVVLVGIFGCLIYCNPRKRPRILAEASVDTKEESIPMTNHRPLPSNSQVPEPPINQNIESFTPPNAKLTEDPTFPRLSELPNSSLYESQSITYLEYGPPNTPVHCVRPKKKSRKRKQTSRSSNHLMSLI